MKAHSAPSRLDRQLEFIAEINALKEVLRRSLLPHTGRRENSAEHSWHVALMAALLAEHANAEFDVPRVIKMLLIHDIVEVDAGDTYLYDTAALPGQHEREEKAAERLFNLLPPDQAQELRALWDEFEKRSTPEAKFAKALDRFQALFTNFSGGGLAWQNMDIHRKF